MKKKHTGPDADQNGDFMPIPDVMKMLFISRSTVERRLRDKSLRKLKCGRRTLVRREDALALVREA